ALERIGADPAEGEDDRTRKLRGTLVEALGTIGADVGTRLRARDLHDASLRAPGSIDPALVAASIATIAASGGAEEFDAFFERFEAATTPQEELRYLSALADFDDP